MAESRPRFSPFGIALFAVVVISILFFMFLMTERGDGRNPDRIDSPERLEEVESDLGVIPPPTQEPAVDGEARQP